MRTVSAGIRGMLLPVVQWRLGADSKGFSPLGVGPVDGFPGRAVEFSKSAIPNLRNILCSDYTGWKKKAAR